MKPFTDIVLMQWSDGQGLYQIFTILKKMPVVGHGEMAKSHLQITDHRCQSSDEKRDKTFRIGTPMLLPYPDQCQKNPNRSFAYTLGPLVTGWASPNT